MCYCLLSDSTAYYLLKIREVHSYFIYDIFTIVEFAFFTIIFSLLLNNKALTKILIPLCLCFVAFIILDSIYLRKPGAFNSLSSGIEAIIMIPLCIYYFFDQLKKPAGYLIYANSSFWIVISILIYLSGTFFVYIIAENSMKDLKFLKMYSLINSSIIIIKNCLLAVSMTTKSDSIKQSNPPEDTFDPDLDVLHPYKT